MYERMFQEKIAAALAMIPGVIVGVNVELDPRINHTTATQSFSQPQTVRSSNSSTKSTTRSESSGARVGAVPNGALGNRAEEVASTSSAGGGNESVVNESQEETESVPGHETVQTVTAGLTPTMVTATINVPQSYFRKLWLEQNPPQQGEAAKEPDAAELLRIEKEEITHIEESVQQLIPQIARGKDPYPRIKVRSFVDTKPPQPEEPSTVETAQSWLAANWRAIGLGVMALIGLGMVRSLVKSGQKVAATSLADAAPAAPPTAAATGPAGPAPATPLAPAGVLKRKSADAEPDLRGELAELVRDDPDAAAAIISSWIGDAV
jgi:flagellar M-ring protein FliF